METGMKTGVVWAQLRNLKTGTVIRKHNEESSFLIIVPQRKLLNSRQIEFRASTTSLQPA